MKEVLIVDDCEDQRLLARLALERLAPGQPVRDFASARACIDAIAARNVDPRLVLLDLHMPEIDGAAAAVSLRQLPQFDPAVRIVMMSSSDAQADVRRACQAGVSSFVHKSWGTCDGARTLGAVIAYWLQFDRASCA